MLQVQELITGLTSGQDYLIESATGSFVRPQDLGGGTYFINSWIF